MAIKVRPCLHCFNTSANAQKMFEMNEKPFRFNRLLVYSKHIEYPEFELNSSCAGPKTVKYSQSRAGVWLNAYLTQIGRAHV